MEKPRLIVANLTPDRSSAYNSRKRGCRPSAEWEVELMTRYTCNVLLALLFGLLVLGRAAAEPSDEPRKTRAVRDIPYYEGEDAHPNKHRLDLFLPKGMKNFPVLFFVHGGAWMSGDRRFLGVYSNLGKHFAREGVGAVVISYRLSPAVRHPEHVKDVARAFAWTHKHIAEYGGRPDQIFVCGHSSGGHLIALLATDDTYLKAEGLSLRAIKGAIPISGVYEIGALRFAFNLPGPMRPPGEGLLLRIETDAKPFALVFGNDLEVRKQASPLTHVKAGCPPFLIIYAERDYPDCDRMSGVFARALRQKKCQAQTLCIESRNHFDIIFKAAFDEDSASEAILGFITRQTQP
jgi:acetyl esterase/lipase